MQFNSKLIGANAKYFQTNQNDLVNFGLLTFAMHYCTWMHNRSHIPNALCIWTRSKHSFSSLVFWTAYPKDTSVLFFSLLISWFEYHMWCRKLYSTYNVVSKQVSLSLQSNMASKMLGSGKTGIKVDVSGLVTCLNCTPFIWVVCN